MYQVNTDYQSLSQRVDTEVKRRTEADSKFSTKGRMIDDIISENELHKYTPELVVEVAAQYGFDIKVCRFGDNAHTHEVPRARANGVWVTMPEHLHEDFTPGGKYISLEDSSICPDCATEYPRLVKEANKKIKQLQSSGLGDVIKFECFPDIF